MSKKAFEMKASKDIKGLAAGDAVDLGVRFALLGLALDLVTREEVVRLISGW